MSEDLHPKRIPGSESATIGDNRIVSYLLNESHERGKHKARVFNALGYSTANAGEFEAAILSQVAAVEGQFQKDNGWGGENWQAIVRLPTASGTAVDLRTYWEVRPNEPPKFLTAHPPRDIRR
jgi:hypothetical protein